MFLYNFTIYLYALIVRIISPFHRKARKMIVGHKDTYRILREQIAPNESYIWFHAASLGEFEQGRPIIEEMKRKYPSYKILLTFFSPSGYEIRKNYPQADVVCYLPFDKKRNVKKFLKLVEPKIAIFIKYEFWYNYINELKKRNIPTYMVSAIFRPNQIFFRWYGFAIRNILHKYTCICVQDKRSEELLANINVNNVKVCGDTRFDRVIDIKNQKSESLHLIELFAQSKEEKNQKIFIAGSSWPKDEDIFIPYFNTHLEVKLIIAPHEIDEVHLNYIESNLLRPFIRYSQATEENIKNYDCVIIDCFGILSSVYAYGDIGYVGGGFGAGIHNILEAAVHHVPIIFGPNFKKFKEANDLIENGGGYAIKDLQAFSGLMDEFLQYEDTLQAAGQHAERYVLDNSGAVARVMCVIDL